MYLDVYLSDASDFDWIAKPDDPTAWHLPRVTELWPYGFQLFWEVTRNIDFGKWEGIQLDWGAWGAKITKAEALELFCGHILNHFYERDKERYQKLLGQIRKLGNEQKLAIVASEL